jgi:hypothetical protein
MNRDVCEHFNPVDLPCKKCSANIQKSTLREAAQQALEALLLTHNLAKEYYDTKWSAIIALRAALAEPVQEPVAFPEGYEPHELPADYTGPLWIEGQVRRLYESATPPQRKPLTEEEIRHMKPVSPDLVDFRSGVRCAERAHGIGE